jgi:hypothetical protein
MFVFTNVNYMDEAYGDVKCPPCPPIATTTPITVTSGLTTSSTLRWAPAAASAAPVTDADTSAPVSNVPINVASSTGNFSKTGVSDATGA